MRPTDRIGGTIAIVMLASALALTSPASGAASTAPACVSSRLNVSAALLGGSVTVSPAPNSLDASYRTQISFAGVPAAALTDVSAVGAHSGMHTGNLVAYSQGDGASFVPNVPFNQGENVTVRAVLTREGHSTPFAWGFKVAVVDTTSRSLETPPASPPPPNPTEFQHFVSRPDLTPPTVTVTVNTGTQTPGDLLLAPYAGTGQYGPMILDGSGGLLWFDALEKGARAADLRVQEYEGQPVLTWWQDPLIGGGHRGAGVVIANSRYLPIDIVRAGNGYEPDLHAFKITPQGTAIFTVYDAIRCNLALYGGPAYGAVADTVAQEIDLRTGLVRYEWHSLDHVPPSDSYVPANRGNGPVNPWDWFHINAIEPQADGSLLIDSRNTWAAYQVNGRSGQVEWRLGGKQSSFAMGPGTTSAWQHDAREQPGGTVTFFDNGGTPKVHPESRGLVVRLNLQLKTATLVAAFNSPSPLLAASQGDLQPLSDGDWFVGWGQDPYFSEFSSAGQLLFHAHLPSHYQSFTVLKYPWSGTPIKPPAMVVRPHGHTGLIVYASWNGATAVASWRLLAGADPHALSPVVTTPRRGFETRIAAGHVPYVAVQALDAQGRVLGTSAIARG